MSAIDLAGFSAKFAGDDDPWRTFTNRDEGVKRAAILHALGAGPHGRIWELASGNGSNSAAIAPRALRLDATEGTAEGTVLTARALADRPRARATRLPLPARPPRSTYDAIVVAELLYYLTPRDMALVARDAARAARPGTVLVLAHHHIDFYDFAQHAAGIHDRFLRDARRFARLRTIRRTSDWIVQAAVAR
ncbi:MAG: methyltransferase [Sphingomonas taxi]|uniref:Methyltransferase n=1 Tax=Sphingomonas taxi TaxID=1549858 RepID=A0A2W5P0N4_9SPHN|nr:MAG: methyltransferase [Sphingomonas taxi]